MEKMEDMLIVWIRDTIHKKVPLTTDIIIEQAKHFHVYVLNHQEHATNELFVGSKGRFAKFKERYSLNNVSFSKEKALADNEATQNYISRLKR